MTLAKRADGWYVENTEPYTVDGETFTDWGPYESSAEAHDIRARVHARNLLGE